MIQIRGRAIWLLAVCAVAGMLFMGSAKALGDTIFTGSSGSLSAKATFALSGTTLTVLLENDSTASAQQGTMLTAVFWNSSQAIGGTLKSVDLGPGSKVVPDGSDYNTGWFGYSTDATTPGGLTYAASSTGLNIQFTDPLVGLTGR